MAVQFESFTSASADLQPLQRDARIDQLCAEIDELDTQIIATIKRRTEVSNAIGRACVAAGSPRFVHRREMAVVAKFCELGQEGHTLAMTLLRLSRSGLGR